MDNLELLCGTNCILCIYVISSGPFSYLKRLRTRRNMFYWTTFTVLAFVVTVRVLRAICQCAQFAKCVTQFLNRTSAVYKFLT